MTVTDGRERPAQRLGNGMGLPLPALLTHQIDLDIPVVGITAQIILPHEPIEIDR